MVTEFSTVFTPKTADQGGSRSSGSRLRPRPRPPLLPSASYNADAPRHLRGPEIRSLSSPTVKRSASPLYSRMAALTPSLKSPAAPMKRSQSADRRQAVTPPSNSFDLKAGGGTGLTSREKILFTSARSLAVSFQGRSFSLQVNKTKPSPVPSSVRRATPERRKATAYQNSNNPDSAKAAETETNPAKRSDSDSESVTGSSDNTLKITKKCSFDNPLSSPRGPINSRRYPSPAYRAVPVPPASPSKQANPTTSAPVRNTASISLPSILCFAADLRSGRIGESRVAEAHELRLLYNRLLQWRFVNARADSSLCAQQSDALWNLSSARFAISRLRNSVKWKRMELLSQRHKLKLASLLRWQMMSLEAWDFMERDYSDSLSGAVESLRASTLRLPVVDGARVEIKNLKDVVCSAADVMQAVLSSTGVLSKKVEEVNLVLLELIHAAAQERALMNQSRDLLSTVASMQGMECSLSTHILQLTPPRVASKFTDTTLGIAID